ncbi:MAG: transcriptional regulator [Pyrinomonadaceae bacterium]
MTPNDDHSYEFDGFTLNPRDRLLFHFNKRIELADKDFDILAYLVQNPKVLIKNQDLENAVWGAPNNLHMGNISNHIAKIRKALGCDPHNPRFIETAHAKRGYRFIAKVRQTQQPIADEQLDGKTSRELAIESHLIAPVFLGQGAFGNIRGPEKETIWAKYKEFKIDKGRLCIFPTGIGVWHLTGQHRFSSLSDVASWRRETYERIIKGKHGVQLYNQELMVPLISRSTEPFGLVLGRIPYVFSILFLKEPKWNRPATIRKAVQLLSSLRPLENITSTAPSATTDNLERRLLDEVDASLDTEEFGLPELDLGFASWGGLSYLKRTEVASQIEADVIEFEIAVQATWWLAKCLYDICLANGVRVKKDLALAIQDMKWQYAKIQGIVATESTARRTMIEAVIVTSRLHRLVEDTIKIYDQL